MHPFITVSNGLNGQFYILLADDAGPIERLENWNYNDRDECAYQAERLAEAYNVRFVK
jgi:hypothetical protein